MPKKIIATKQIQCTHCKHSIKKGATYYEFPVSDDIKGFVESQNIQCLNCHKKHRKELKVIERIMDNTDKIKMIAQDLIDIEKYPASNKVEVIFVPTGFKILVLTMEQYQEHLDIGDGSISDFKDFAYAYYCDECEQDDPKAMYSATVIDTRTKTKVKRDFSDLVPVD